MIRFVSIDTFEALLVGDRAVTRGVEI